MSRPGWDTLAWCRSTALSACATALAAAASLVVYAAYRLGVLNERAYPGDREAIWTAITTTGEGAYLLGLVALCVASQVICHWMIGIGKHIGGNHE